MAANTSSDDSNSGPGNRHPAVRAFASEFQDATHDWQPGNNEQAPRYTLLPTGIRANRFFVIGVLTSREVEDRDDGGQSIRANLSDGTESYTLSCTTKFNPDPSHSLKEIETPQIVSVVGKANHWGDEGEQVDLRPETVSVVSKADRQAWVLETAAKTRDRVSDYQQQAVVMDDPESVGEDVEMAQEKYDAEAYDYLDNALEVVDKVVSDD